MLKGQFDFFEQIITDIQTFLKFFGEVAEPPQLLLRLIQWIFNFLGDSRLQLGFQLGGRF